MILITINSSRKTFPKLMARFFSPSRARICGDPDRRLRTRHHRPDQIVAGDPLRAGDPAPARKRAAARRGADRLDRFSRFNQAVSHRAETLQR